MAGKAKAKTMLVKLVSTAQTGFFYSKVKKRGGPTLSLMKYDPKDRPKLQSAVKRIGFSSTSRAPPKVREKKKGQEATLFEARSSSRGSFARKLMGLVTSANIGIVTAAAWRAVALSTTPPYHRLLACKGSKAMKGLTKAIMRTPHLMTSKVGMAKKSSDPEFDEYNRHFTVSSTVTNALNVSISSTANLQAMEAAAEALLKDAKAFAEAVGSSNTTYAALLTSGHQGSVHFANIFQPTSNEYNLESKHPDASNTLRNADQYQTEMDELRLSLSPELELIEGRIIGPVKELQGVMKLIRKNITKRDHKAGFAAFLSPELTDYDRFNNSLVKLREKKEKTLADEKNLFKLEQDFEQATSEYEMFNNALKTDLPRFMQLAAQFIDPLFHSFYYMQLNIFYLMLEKLNYFCEKKYDTAGTTQDVVNTYEQRRGDAREQVEALGIAKKYISTAKQLQASRSASGGLSPGGGLSRATSSASTLRTSPTSYAPPSRAATVSSSASKFGSLASKKAPPPPPPGASLSANAAAPPPPYSPAGAGAAPSLARSVSATSGGGIKKAPPPPPPVKPKPAPAPKPVVYVTALYDFDAQAEGDLSFRAGDRIEIVQRSESTDDWWTGKLNGQQGVFPVTIGNYVQA
ncbi:hypothetical protein FRC00_003263 [Tulasnella sp. 408]|nr:hypothetical protein FRC00_003263 [Tulasnella sp. 408]